MSPTDQQRSVAFSKNDSDFWLHPEAKFHAVLSDLASLYVKLIRKSVLPKLDMPKSFTIRDLQVLYTVAAAANGITSSKIFRSTGLDPATVTRSAKTMIKAGYLESEENANDSRSRILKITASGRALANAYSQACNELFRSSDLNIPHPNRLEWDQLFKEISQLKNRVQILTLKSF